MRLFVVALGLAVAAPASAGEQVGWTLYTSYRNGKIETVTGLSKEVCQTIRKASLAAPGPRGPSGMPISGHLDPSEIREIECLASRPVS